MVQVLRAGDSVVAAARKPEQSPGLAKLKKQFGTALQLVKLDMNDGASLTVCVLFDRQPSCGLFLLAGPEPTLAASLQTHTCVTMKTRLRLIAEMLRNHEFAAASALQAAIGCLTSLALAHADARPAALRREL